MLHEHIVELVASEHVYFVATDRAFSPHLNQSVLILGCGDTATDRKSVIVSQCHLVVEFIYRTCGLVLLLGNSGFGFHLLLLVLLQACEVILVCSLLDSIGRHDCRLCAVNAYGNLSLRQFDRLAVLVGSLHNSDIMLLAVVVENGVGVVLTKRKSAVNVIGGFLCNALADFLLGSFLFLNWVNGLLHIEDVGRANHFDLASLSVTNDNTFVAVGYIYHAAVVHHGNIATHDVNLSVLIFHSGRLHHASGLVYTCVNLGVGLAFLVGDVVLYVGNHAVPCCFGVEIVRCSLNLLGAVGLTHSVNGCNRVVTQYGCDVALTDTELFLHLLRTIVQHVLCVVHLLRRREAVTVIKGSLRVGLQGITILVASTLLLCLLHATVLLYLFSILHGCLLLRRRIVVRGQHLNQLVVSLLVIAKSHGVAYASPCILISKCCACCIICGGHSLSLTILWRAVACGLNGAHEAAHKANAKERVNVLVEVEHASALGIVHCHVAHNGSVHDVTCNFLGILTKHAVPLGMLLEVGNNLSHV